MLPSQHRPQRAKRFAALDIFKTTGHIGSVPKPNVRNKLLVAGLDTVHSRGFNASSVQDITEAAGVPKGSFYNHFESKQGLGAEILGHYWHDVVSPNLPILSDATLGPRARLQRYFDVLAEGLAEQGYLRGCLIGNLSAELADHSPTVRDQLASLLAEWTSAVEGCVQEAQEAGEVRTDLDAGTIAEFLVNAWEGVVLRTKVDKDEYAPSGFCAVVFTMLFA